MRAASALVPTLGLCLLLRCDHRPAQQYGLPAMVRGVGIDQNLNAQIPLELTFKDETGQTVRLGQYFRQKPVVLALVYYECPMLCNMVLNGLTHSMEQISLERRHRLRSGHRQLQSRAKPGSSPPRKKPTTSKSTSARAPPEGWHFLTGQEDNIKKLADAVGFHYKYDPISKQFAHASGIMVMTPEGKHRALLLRNRIQAARFPPGPGGSLAAQDRIARRRHHAVLLSTTIR